MRTIDRIITKVNTTYGAPMGRMNRGENPCDGTKVFDCRVPLNNGAYDRGGAYWGFPDNLRVQYTKDLTYINFYRT